MNSNEMLLGRTRNAGFVERSTYVKADAFENRLAAIMAQRAGIPNADLAIKGLLEASLDAQSGSASATDTFSMEEYETSHDDLAEGFAGLISPLRTDEFFEQQYRHRKPMVFRGPVGRFSSLMLWKDLNDLVRNRNLRFPQLQMVIEGQPIPDADYMRSYYGLGTINYGISENRRIDEHNLIRYLRNGATLIINSVWTVHEPINVFLSAIGSMLGTNISVNLYASWKETRGFATHWDAHDVYIVQVQGSKVWSVYGEGRVLPTSLDVEPNDLSPTEILWSGTLTSGDVLYIPRGWWHDAVIPKELDGEGSIHLTVSLQQFTGTHVLTWLASKLAATCELFRDNVPRHAGGHVVREYFDALRQVIIQALEGELAQEFIDDMQSVWSEDIETYLDRRIDPWTDAKWDSYTITLRGAKQARLSVHRDAHVFFLIANGFTHELNMHCFDLVKTMVERGELSVAELKEYNPAQFPEAFVDGFLIQLVKENIVSVSLRENGFN